MPVEKFRSVEDMPRPQRDSRVPLHERIAAAWERAHLHGRPVLPRGVQKFATLEDAAAARKAFTRARLRARS